MGLFNRKKILPDDFFQGACDMHSHLLPGVDDGFHTMEDAEEGLHYLENLGFRRLILTPHVMMEYKENNRAFLESRFEMFRNQVEGKTQLELRLAAENMMDEHFSSHREEGWLPLRASDNTILVETSYMYKGYDMDNTLYNLVLDGYSPVIAHPERYQYADGKLYAQWRHRGYRFQLNLISLAGGYGEPAKEKALYLLDRGMYEYVGTDMHKISTYRRWMPELKLKTAQMDVLHRLYENNARLFE